MMIDYFKTVNEVHLNSLENGSPYIINISILDIHIAAFSRMMWEEGYFFSTKTACSSGNDYSSVIYDLTNDLDKASASIRISIGKFNTEEEIKAFIKTFDECLEKVRGNECG